MEDILINVSPKRYASPAKNVAIIRDNTDYTARFTFAEGSGFEGRGLKTAVFVTARGKQTRTFVGETCVIPMMEAEDGDTLRIGVEKGDLKTTAKAVIPLVDSINTNAGTDVDAATPDTPIASELSLDDTVKVNQSADGMARLATLEQIGNLIGGSGGASGVAFVTTDSPFADIQSAVEANKTVILRLVDGDAVTYIPCTFYNADERDTYAVFSREYEDEWSKVAYYCTLSEGVTTWTEEQLEGAFVSVNEQYWNDTAKAQARANIGAGTYSKPSGGIPAADLASGVIPQVPEAATSAPADLASAAAVGSSTKYAREDHKHKLPSASDVGALPSSTTYVSSVNGQSGAVTLTIPEKLVVTYTLSAQTSGSSATCDHTYTEIATALQAKTPIEAYAVYGGYVIGALTGILFDGTVYFSIAGTNPTYNELQTFDISHNANETIKYWAVSTKPSSTSPNMDGTASAGSSTDYARADHTHPSDTSKITAPTSPSTGDFLCWNGTAWAATTLANWQGGNY